MPHRSFDFTPPVDADGDEPKEPITFELAGLGQITKEPWKESFTAVPVAPPGVLDDLTSSMGADKRGNRVWHAPSLLGFMRGILIDEDIDRFEDLMRDKDRAIKIEALGEIMLWVAQELVDRPTSR